MTLIGERERERQRDRDRDRERDRERERELRTTGLDHSGDEKRRISYHN
jgi:hypothetical protein